jgi:protein SCO1
MKGLRLHSLSRHLPDDPVRDFRSDESARQGRRPRPSPLFITVDPERDSPAALKDYLSNFDPHLRGLSGDRAAVDAALKTYRVNAKKIPLKDDDYTMDHTAIVYLMDKDDRFVATFNLNQTPEAAADQLRGYL